MAAWLAAAAIVAGLVLDGRRVALERGERATSAIAVVVEQQVNARFNL